MLTVQQTQSNTVSDKCLGEILVDQGAVTQQLVGAAVEKQKPIRTQKYAKAHIVRVNSNKLDELNNMVGELVIASDLAPINPNKQNVKKELVRFCAFVYFWHWLLLMCGFQTHHLW